MASANDILLKVHQLVKHFPVIEGSFFRHRAGVIHAVDGVSFDVRRGETLGLVGESGCGKSTTGRTILQLYKPTAGSVLFNGVDLVTLKEDEMRKYRRKMQMIFQDPYASLNPRMTVGEIIADPLLVYQEVRTKKDIDDKVSELLELVKLDPSHINRYPHEFSGGQRQRIGVARSLALRPDLIVCDEPISALDVSIQAQVVNLLVELQKKFNLTYLFIAHDLSMVRHICDRVAVMYLGVIVELAERNDFYHNPLHPYTKALLSAVSIPDPRVEAQRKRTILKGEIPSPVNPPSGCRFHTRCPIAKDICSQVQPEWREITPGHFTACHFV
jgi:oligopeptide transport system ATP-binding protein